MERPCNHASLYVQLCEMRGLIILRVNIQNRSGSPISSQRRMKHRGNQLYEAFGCWATTSESVDACNVDAEHKLLSSYISHMHLRSWSGDTDSIERGTAA